MTEPKSKYTASPQKPTKLPPGSTPPPLSSLTINGESLSKKQLYEIITEKNIKIDTLLIEIGRLKKELKTKN